MRVSKQTKNMNNNNKKRKQKQRKWILFHAPSSGTPHEGEGHVQRAYERRKPWGGKVTRRVNVLKRQKQRECLAQGGKPHRARGANRGGWKGRGRRGLRREYEKARKGEYLRSCSWSSRPLSEGRARLNWYRRPRDGDDG